MDTQILNHRNRLSKTRHCLENGILVVGFIGGSITDPRGGHNWPEGVVSWLVEEFPNVRIIVENAAIGATGSDLATFRAKRDLIDRGCDLVFVEFAVNDNGTEKQLRMKTREGLIRQLLGAGCDVVLVYTFIQDMYADMIEGRVPASIDEFEQLAGYYGIGSAWVGLYALNEVMNGRMRWEVWLPDGLHPKERGSTSYAQCVIGFLMEELAGTDQQCILPNVSLLPPPIDKQNWEKVQLLPFSEVKTQGPWRIQRSSDLVWMDQLLMTSAIGSRLSFSFEGRGLCLGFDFGKNSSEFRYRLDDGQWISHKRDRPDWCGVSGWYRISNIADDLPDGKHVFELDVTHGDRQDCAGTNFYLALIGIIKR